MTSSPQANVKCRNCGGEYSVTTYPVINISAAPELKAKVKDGSLFIRECPHCGHRELALFQTIYHDPEEKLMIWLMPEDTLSESGLSTLENQMASLAEQISADSSGRVDGYTLRRVSDAGSLIEKVNIFDAGLDDAAMEICKRVTKLELTEKEPDKAAADAVLNADFKFYRLDGADNELIFSYPAGGKMIGIKTGFNVYEDCCGILRRNPASRPGAGFVKVDADWLASVFG